MTDPQQDLQTLQTRLEANRQEAAEALDSGNLDAFDRLTRERSDLLGRVQPMKAEANAQEISEAKAAIGQVVSQVIQGKHLGSLLGEAVKTVAVEYLYSTDENGEDTTTTVVSINRPATASRKTRTGNGGQRGSDGSPQRDLQTVFAENAGPNAQGYMSTLNLRVDAAQQDGNSAEVKRLRAQQWSVRNKVAKDPAKAEETFAEASA